MTKTKKVLTAATAVLVLILALSCAGVKARESQFPLARQVWTSVKPLADLGAPSIPFAEAEIVKLDAALAAGSREGLAIVSMPLVSGAADAGVNIRVEARDFTPEVGRYLKMRNAMFAELVTEIGGGQ